MTEFKLINDNTKKHAPENPTITYEIIVDMGKDGTKTVYSHDDYSKVHRVMEKIKEGGLDIPDLDLDEDELENVTGVSINIVLTASSLDIIKYDGETSATAELVTYEVKH